MDSLGEHETKQISSPRSWHGACVAPCMKKPTSSPFPRSLSVSLEALRTLAGACRRAAPWVVAAPLVASCGATAEPPPLLESAPIDAAAPVEDAAPAVHVSSLGDDAGSGTADAPVRTFAEAIARARRGSRRLALCAGVFTEPLVLDAARGADAFEVRGAAPCLGFSAAETVVRTRGTPALSLFALGGPVRIDRITFEREDAAAAGESAVAGTIAFVDEVHLSRVVLRAGRGASGSAGAGVVIDPCDEPIDPRTPTHVGAGGRGATYAGELLAIWSPTPGEDGGVLRFPRSSRCVEPTVLAGAGGGGGGGSIALTVRAAHVALEGATLTSTDAGRGGDGGHAQAPACDPLAQKSCEVLDIGGGGGGAGGVSAAIVSRDAVFDIDPATRLLAGAAGAGGAAGRGARWLHGTSGVAGLSAPTLDADTLGPTWMP
jgi:hypothetical protein